jgi:hypothetical protein
MGMERLKYVRYPDSDSDSLDSGSLSRARNRLTGSDSLSLIDDAKASLATDSVFIISLNLPSESELKFAN